MEISVVTKEKIALLIVIFFMVTLMWACVKEPLTKEVWSKTNATQKEFIKDRNVCMKEAGGTTEIEHTEGEVVKNVELYNFCMEARGWKLKEVKSASDNLNNREILTFADGTKYEGNVVDGKMHGRGTYTWANGHKYEGDWIEGKFSGRGTYTCNNGKQFNGNFKNNEPVGFSINCAVSNSEKVSVPQNTAGGYPKQGSYTDAKGNKYQGDIVSGKLHGRGTLTSPGGNKYEGDFVDGKINGRGTYTCSNGKQFTGIFKNNKPVGFTVKCD